MIEEKLTPAEITFEKWRKTLGLFIVLFLLIISIHPPEKKRLSRIRGYIKERRRKSGWRKKGEKNALAAFLIAVSLWILPGLFAVLGKRFFIHHGFLESHLPEAMVALLAALTLFVLPTNWKKREFTLSWRQAARIDWGTILTIRGRIDLG